LASHDWLVHRSAEREGGLASHEKVCVHPIARAESEGGPKSLTDS
jgi:hypothetical protein